MSNQAGNATALRSQWTISDVLATLPSQACSELLDSQLASYLRPSSTESNHSRTRTAANSQASTCSEVDRAGSVSTGPATSAGLMPTQLAVVPWTDAGADADTGTRWELRALQAEQDKACAEDELRILRADVACKQQVYLDRYAPETSCALALERSMPE